MTNAPLLEIDDLHVTVDGSEILRGLSLSVGEGEVHALMGPNGSGKSTLANTLLANPAYEVTRGRIRFRGEDVTTLPTDERAARGIFLGFQHPEEIKVMGIFGHAEHFLRSVHPEQSFSDERLSGQINPFLSRNRLPRARRYPGHYVFRSSRILSGLAGME
jgi:Fe-S cluster assembly ATPase SufC